MANDSTQSQSHRVPPWAWPWIFGIFMAGYPPLFYLVQSFRSELKEANDKNIERLAKENLSIRKQNEMLTRLLYTSENMARWLYTDSVVVAQRKAASSRKESADNDSGQYDSDN